MRTHSPLTQDTEVQTHVQTLEIVKLFQSVLVNKWDMGPAGHNDSQRIDDDKGMYLLVLTLSAHKASWCFRC